MVAEACSRRMRDGLLPAAPASRSSGAGCAGYPPGIMRDRRTRYSVTRYYSRLELHYSQPSPGPEEDGPFNSSEGTEYILLM